MPGLRRWRWVIVHACVVAALLLSAYLLMAQGYATGTRATGAHASMIGLDLLGQPWRMLLVSTDLDKRVFGHIESAHTALRDVVFYGPALANLLIHAAIRSVLR